MEAVLIIMMIKIIIIIVTRERIHVLILVDCVRITKGKTYFTKKHDLCKLSPPFYSWHRWLASLKLAPGELAHGSSEGSE